MPWLHLISCDEQFDGRVAKAGPGIAAVPHTHEGWPELLRELDRAAVGHC